MPLVYHQGSQGLGLSWGLVVGVWRTVSPLETELMPALGGELEQRELRMGTPPFLPACAMQHFVRSGGTWKLLKPPFLSYTRSALGPFVRTKPSRYWEHSIAWRQRRERDRDVRETERWASHGHAAAGLHSTANGSQA
ncbi:hypothetical protein CPAR01_05146 [Colletotrichum paranaense]|uniref:Uncharacterized protein n=1 Tax=Colletotrichum paranaense TaxID=1914294 RepID=A0ABQ9SQF6_9PEZI|nr:uncharacterized protein CPAR01_05146 [Colletotrichum paranaense]KAK1541759.1 hypothetical protein CPAR01_05146 [Colletotrichum paranaense]